jgi:predicted nucleic acid-binding protein
VSLGSLQRTLRDARTISVDTAVFLASADPGDRRQACARWLLDEVETGRFACVISALSAAELLVRPSTLGPAWLSASVAALGRFPHLTVRSFTFEDAGLAAQVRATTRLRMPDAVVVATALAARVDALVHCDDEWDAKAAPYARAVAIVNLNSHCA